MKKQLAVFVAVVVTAGALALVGGAAANDHEMTDEPMLVRHSEGYAEAFLVADGHKTWVSAECLAGLAALGIEPSLAPWSEFGSLPNSYATCAEVEAVLTPHMVARLVAHSDTYPAAWVLYDGQRLWIPPGCMNELLAVGVEREIVPWDMLSSYPLIQPKFYCEDLQDLFGVEFLAFGTPLFGLGDDADEILAIADAGAGIWLTPAQGAATLIPLPGVSDVAYVGGGEWVAITGEPPEAPLGLPGSHAVYLIGADGVPQPIANLLDFELATNSDGGDDTISNPFSIAVETVDSFLVADAGANVLLRVHRDGTVELAGTFPLQLLPHPNPAVGDIPAQPVVTSVAVDEFGYIYVGELTGFPATPGASRIWELAPGASGVACPSTDCRLVGTGFTSIMDLGFDSGGLLYVLEFDTASWLAVESTGGPVEGGKVSLCLPAQELECISIVEGLPVPTAIEDLNGTLFATIFSLVPGLADVVPLN